NQPVVAGATTYAGTGNLTFINPVSYSGPTNVSAGTLTLSGNGALTQTAAANTVQVVSLQKVSGGNFTLTFNGQTTAGIPFTNVAGGAATAAAIQTALGNLTNIGTLNVSVVPYAGSTANNQDFQVIFQGTLAGAPQPLMTLNTSGLTAFANIVLGSVSMAAAGSAGLTLNTGGTVVLDNTGV